MRTVIHTIVHCYDPPGMSQYSRMLRYLLTSHVWCPQNVDWRVTVCCAKKAPQIDAVAESFANVSINVEWLRLPLNKLFRRAIGRDMAVQGTRADVVHFTDCDYFYGPGCLQSIADCMSSSSGLCVPAWYKICQDHGTGDRILCDNADEEYPIADRSLFVPKKAKVAIGGMQFIGGDRAREIGYQCGRKLMHPVDVAKGFRSCKCDKAWRRHNELSTERVDISELYRLRHSSDGRDYNIRGDNIGKATW